MREQRWEQARVPVNVGMSCLGQKRGEGAELGAGKGFRKGWHTFAQGRTEVRKQSWEQATAQEQVGMRLLSVFASANERRAAGPDRNWGRGISV